MLGYAIAGVCGCVMALAWSSTQAAVPQLGDALEEPARVTDTATLVLVASDGSTISKAIDDATGALGFSHCYLDFGHSLEDGPHIIDYQPGQGVHYAPADRYDARRRATVQFRGPIACELWGCVRGKLGQPFDAAGILVGSSTLGTCAGLVFGCLPADVQRGVFRIGRTVSPNDFARFFAVAPGDAIVWGE
jgi:hypothetical protein